MERRKILDEYFQNEGEKKNTWYCQVLHALCLWSWYWPLLLWGCRAHISLYKWLAIIIIIIITRPKPARPSGIVGPRYR